LRDRKERDGGMRKICVVKRGEQAGKNTGIQQEEQEKIEKIW
jgi:hypothetical protein